MKVAYQKRYCKIYAPDQRRSLGEWKSDKEFHPECDGRRYGFMEDGYNHAVLGKNMKTLLQGLE